MHFLKQRCAIVSFTVSWYNICVNEQLHCFWHFYKPFWPINRLVYNFYAVQKQMFRVKGKLYKISIFSTLESTPPTQTSLFLPYFFPTSFPVHQLPHFKSLVISKGTILKHKELSALSEIPKEIENIYSMLSSSCKNFWKLMRVIYFV